MKPRRDRRLSIWPGALSLRSMRGRMALLLGLAMLPAGAVAMQLGLNAVAARQSAFEESLGRRALQSISVERSAIDEMRELLRVVAASPALQQPNREQCIEWLASVVERYPYVSGIGVTNESDVVLCSVPAVAPGFRVRQTTVRERARARDGFTMGYTQRSSITGQEAVVALEPIRDGDGRRIGFVSASIRVARLREILDRGRTLDGARAAIFDFSGRAIAESSFDPERAPGLPTPDQIRNRLGPDPAFIDVRGGAAVVAPLQAPDLYIALAWAPERPAWRRWAELATALVAPIAIWLLAIGAGWFAIEIYITRPLSSLETAARAYARGEDVPEAAALAAAPEEIRTLRRTLAAMAKTLRGREQRLIEALAEERALLREVHHRVKNNLQTVASLLSIQSRGAGDESEARGLARAHDRVQMLAMVHQRIYASGAVRGLRVDELAADIARQLLQSRGLQSRLAQFDFGEVSTNADRAGPLAFLIGESVSAALDGLAPGPAAALTLYLRQDEDGEVRFAIEAEAAPGAGLSRSARLIDAFVRQLGAEIGRDPARPLALWVRVPPQQA